MSNKSVVVGVSLQVSGKNKRRSVVASYSAESFPLEVSMLLDVFSRIEARRQARLRAMGRG